MNNVEILCARDQAMLSEFSRRALAHIIGRPFSALQLPFVTNYLEANVLKEAEKDRIIIEYAASACMAGACAKDLDVDLIFEKTKAVDSDFVRKLSIPSFAVSVRYQDIAGIRKKRILCVSKAVMDILQGWSDQITFEARMRQAYSDLDFRKVLLEILRLYNEETMKLSGSITILHPFNMAINLFAETLFESMELAAEELTENCAARLYAVPGNA